MLTLKISTMAALVALSVITTAQAAPLTPLAFGPAPTAPFPIVTLLGANPVVDIVAPPRFSIAPASAPRVLWARW